jgi:hypothetical protein
MDIQTLPPPTDNEFETVPHVHLTSKLEWDPSALDHTLQDASEWCDATITPPGILADSRFDEFGRYHRRVLMNSLSHLNTYDVTSPDVRLDQCIFHAHVSNDTSIPSIAKGIVKKDPDFASLHPLFGWMSYDIINKTFQHISLYARLPTGTTLKTDFKSPNPALNVTRRNEAVAYDIVYSDVPAIDYVSIAAVIFVGTETQVTDIHCFKSDRRFVNTLEDYITRRGAPYNLISDSARSHNW